MVYLGLSFKFFKFRFKKIVPDTGKCPTGLVVQMVVEPQMIVLHLVCHKFRYRKNTYEQVKKKK